jgi:hypothetical protein
MTPPKVVTDAELAAVIAELLEEADSCEGVFPGMQEDLRRWASRLQAIAARDEGYPGIAHDFEMMKMQLAAARHFFDSPQSFSQEEFQAVGRKVYGCKEYTGLLPTPAAPGFVLVPVELIEQALAIDNNDFPVSVFPIGIRDKFAAMLAAPVAQKEKGDE